MGQHRNMASAAASGFADGIAALTVERNALAVVWRDGAAVRIPHLWLRHNCDCDQCMVRQTSEKRFQIFAAPAHLKPAEAWVEPDAQAIAIAWPDGHRSRFCAESLRGSMQPPRRQLRHWDATFQPQRLDFADFLEDDHAAAAFIARFLAEGAGVLANGPTEPNSLEGLAPRLGPVREVLFERIHNVQVDPAGYNIAHTSEHVPPHNDMVSYAWPPTVQALHMLANECSGGNTGIVDGFAVLERLRREQPAQFQVLCAVAVPFRQFDANAETNASAPTIELDAAGDIRTLRFSNQLMQRVRNASGVVVETRRLHGRTQADRGKPRWKSSLRLDWRRGPWQAAWTFRYIHSMTERCSNFLDGSPDSLTNLGLCSMPNHEDNSESRNRLSSILYHDARIGYEAGGLEGPEGPVGKGGWTATLGVNNLFNRDPPISRSATLNGYDASTYDIPGGRFAYLEIAYARP